MSKKKAPTLPALVRKLDSVFSKYIRMKYADEGGTVSCVCCGELMPWQEAHNAHFVSRRHMSLRFSELNCHPCCPRCNVFEYGALDEYSRFIIDTYGRETFDELLRLKRMTKKWTRDELCELIMKYQNLVHELTQKSAYVDFSA